jgi:hypothetical protein
VLCAHNGSCVPVQRPAARLGALAR